MKLSVIIPCHNEALSITETIRNLGNDIYEIIVIDNNCSDDTSKFAIAAGAKVIKEKSPGYGIAIQTGLAAAGGDIVAVLDGDGQYPSEKVLEIARLLEERDFDFISGARFPLDNKKAMTSVRKFGNYFFNFFIRTLFNIRLADSQSGMWVFKKNILEKISLECRGMAFSEELKIKVIAGNFRFIEKKISYNPRHEDSASKLSPFLHGFGNLFYLLKLCSKINVAKLSGNSTLFFVFGVVASVALYFALSLPKINAPFIYGGLDVNVWNGLAAQNWLKFGAINLMFGNYPSHLANDYLAFGNFYTHHPSYYLFFPYFFYKIFGVSEWATRAGIVTFMGLSMPLFGYAIKRFFNSALFAVLTLLIFAMMPGVVFYGSTLELAIFSLPSSIITYSLYLLYCSSGKKLHLYYFFASIIFGGLMGWFYFFMPLSIWLLILINAKKNSNRRLLLAAIPLLLIIAATITLTNFYIIKGDFFNLFDAFLYRSHSVDFNIWFSRVFYFVKLHFTWPFLITAIAGFVALIHLRRAPQFAERYIFLLPLVFSPIFMAGVLTQWFTHPFGSIFISLPVATLSSFLLTIICGKFKFLGAAVSFIVLAVAFIFSWNNLQFYYREFRLVGERDVALLKGLRPVLKDGELCVDPKFDDRGGIVDNIDPILTWYFGKSYLVYPECLRGKYSNKIKALIISRPSMAVLDKNLTNDMEASGWVNNGPAEWWYLWTR